MNAGEPESRSNAKLVVVGASAGGVEAVSTLVGKLPADFPAPIVLAQHLDPQRRSHLESILQRCTTLPIVVVDARTLLEPGKVYVVPANTHISIADGHAELEGDYRKRPRPSVDLLLSTAARAYGENLIAVILTGSGSDGAAGAVEVSQAGGTVVIQNPQTALYPAMPLALPPTVVDYVVDIQEMGPLLYELVRGLGQATPPPELDDPLRDIMDRVSRQSSIDFRQYKPATIVRRIARRMNVTRNQSMGEYAYYLDQHPEEVGELVRSFLIKVTEFFRDSDAFATLRTTILPELILRGRANGRVLRFWSAGCATGEEPYSLALLLADLLGAELSAWTVRIFATDLDEGAIAFARVGLYPENVLRNLPKDYRERFFEPVEQGFRVSKTLRQMVIFGQQDLSRGVPFPRIDMVVCRNLLIYFKPELQQSVLDIFAYSLQQAGGYLFLGQAETVRPSKATYELVNKRWKIYRCLNGPLPLLSSLSNPAAVQTLPQRMPPARRIRAAEPVAPAAPFAPVPDPELGQLRHFNESVMRFLPNGVVILDRAYRIVTINSAARRMLKIRDSGHDQDFLHAARGLSYEQLRGAIDAVFRERGAATLSELEVAPAVGGDPRYFTFNIMLMQVETPGMDLIVTTVTDVTDQVQTRRRLETVQREQKQLLDDVQVANRQLGELNKELQDANEELQAANEEMMLTQEELQATNEEFEATNEELQATNEELETNNEELQATNEELETTNEELQARTSELTEVTHNLRTERARLVDMVELAPFYTLLLRGPDLRIVALNPRYAHLLGAGEAVGRSLDEVFTDAAQIELLPIVRDVYRHNTVQTTPRLLVMLPNDQGRPVPRYFVYTVVPTHDAAGGVDGAVVYAEDVSAQVEYDATERRENLKLMIEHADQVALALFDGSTTRLLQASPRYLDIVERAAGYARDDIIGRTWAEVAFVSRAPDEALALFRSVLAGAPPRRLPGVHVRLGQENETIWDCSLTPIRFGPEEDETNAQFMVVSAVEITAPALALQQLEDLDRLKDEFMSLASHELRTPLVPLRGYADLLTRLIRKQANEPGWDPRIGEYAGKINQQTRYLNRLIDDLFDATRLRTGKFTLDKEQVDLVGVVAQAVEQGRMLASSPPIDFAPPENGAPLIADIDPQRITQVVLNLLQNAIKHAAESPTIEVRVHRLPAARRPRKQDADHAAPQAEITVRDQGPGIPPEVRSSLFTPYYQAPQGDPHKAGLGLGLFIAQQIVEQHGGTITLESTAGEGTTFTVRLPLASTQ